MFFITPNSAKCFYKSFIRPHLDYGDVIYDPPSSATLSSKIESIQYNAALTTTEAIRGSSREKLLQEFGLEYLHDRRSVRCLCLFYKVLLNKVTKYIYELIPPFRHSFKNVIHSPLLLAVLSTLRIIFSECRKWLEQTRLQNLKIVLPILVSKMP